MKKYKTLLFAILGGLTLVGTKVSAQAPNDITNLKYQDKPIRQFIFNKPVGEYEEIQMYRDGIYMEMTKGYSNKTIGDFSADNLEDFQTYHYQFITVNNQGEKSKGVEYTLNTGNIRPPDAPRVSNIKDKSSETTIELYLYQYNPEEDFKEFEVYRDGVFLGSTTSSNFIDKNLLPNHTYNYCVRSVDTGGLKSYCTIVKAITNPEVPKNISVSYPDKDNMVITWNHNGNSENTMYQWKFAEIDGIFYKSLYSSGGGPSTRKNEVKLSSPINGYPIGGRKFEFTLYSVGDNGNKSSEITYTFVTPRDYSEPTLPKENNQNLTIYTVQPGDTLFAISRKFTMTVEELQNINNRTGLTIYAGLKLWVKDDKEETPIPSPEPIQTVKTYTVQKGDTLYKISQTFGVSINQILTINNLSGTTLSIGQILQLEEKPSAPANNTIYVVKKGDTLYSISKLYNTTPTKLQEDNKLTSTTLYIGQPLSILK